MVIIIRISIKMLAMILWAAIGTFVWIPMLVAMTSFFMAMIVSASFSKVDVSSARIGLDKAISLFPDGFQRISGSLSGETPSDTDIKPIGERQWISIGLGFLYVALFWAALAGVALASYPEHFGILEPKYEPNAGVEFQASTGSNSGKFRVTLERLRVGARDAGVSVLFCNAGNDTINRVTLHLWYEAPSGNVISMWLAGNDAAIELLRPGSCVEIERTADLLILDEKIEQPFGLLHVSLGRDESLGKIDLAQADSNGRMSRKYL